VTEAPGQPRRGTTNRSDDATAARVVDTTDSAPPPSTVRAEDRPAGNAQAELRSAADASLDPGAAAAQADRAVGGGQTFPPPSYGTASFAPGTVAPALAASDAAAPLDTSAGTGGVPGAGTLPPTGGVDPTSATAPGAPDPGARNWRDQWRAARSALSDDSAQAGEHTANTATIDSSSAAVGAGLVSSGSAAASLVKAGPGAGGVPGSAPEGGDDAARRSGIRAAFAAGLSQAKAVAAGSWTVPSKTDAATTMSSPIPGLRTEGDGPSSAPPATAVDAGTSSTAGAAIGTKPVAAVRSTAAGPVEDVVSTGGGSIVGAGAGAGVGLLAGAGVGLLAGGAVNPVVGAGVGAGVAPAVGTGARAPTGATAIGAPARPLPDATRPAPVDQVPALGKPAPATRKVARKPTAGRVRRAHLKLTRIDPWTIMKVSFMLSIAFGIMTIVAVGVVWSMLDAAGVFTSVDETVKSVTGEGGGALGFDLMSWVGFDRVMGFTTLIAVVDVVLITALATLGAFLYNLASSLLGGVEVTLVEDHQ